MVFTHLWKFAGSGSKFPGRKNHYSIRNTVKIARVQRTRNKSLKKLMSMSCMLFQVGGENILSLINNIHIIYMKNQRRRNELKIGGGGWLTIIGVSVRVSVGLGCL